MGLRKKDIVATLILNLIHCAYTADHILSCNISELDQCPGDKQFCSGTTNKCECMNGLELLGDDCEVPGPASTGSRGTTAAVVTIFALALIICGLFLVIRKYKLVEYVRQKINLRRNNDVMYEDVMIGHDDPPLSP